MQLTDEQRAAIDLAVVEGPPLACLTGGPGTGKTTTLRQLLEAAGAAGLRSACAAPSGKAAQRMEEATGRRASTLHRLMGLLPGSRTWDPIEADLLVIDEASMVDVPLMAAALEAAAAGQVRTVLLVGDADQLPPVGPGQPFHDLLAGQRCPSVRLTQVHRQAQESGIIRAAHAINRGEEPELDAPDFQLVDCDELEDIPAAVWDVVQSNELDPNRSQILCPQRGVGGSEKGGTIELNDYVERSRRPIRPGEPLIRDRFRRETKVINCKNDYSLGVFNGELGTVVNATDGGKKRSADQLDVLIAGEMKRYRGSAIKHLQPAYALTVHKSQGSQWDDVVVVTHTAHTWMLTRRLLYVAVTRAAKRVWLVGQRAAIAKAARNTTDAKRATWLGSRFSRDLERERAAEAL